MNSNYPPDVTGFEPQIYGPKIDPGDPGDATCHDSTFDQWREFVEPSLDYDDEELLELYDDGKTPREVNGGRDE